MDVSNTSSFPSSLAAFFFFMFLRIPFMENEALTVGTTIASEPAPDYSPMQDFDGEAQEVVVVPGAGDIDLIESGIQESLFALECLCNAEANIAENELTPVAARTVAAALEMAKTQLRMPSAEAFASSPKALSAYAREAVAAQQESIFERIVNFLIDWGKSVLLWIRSLVNKRLAAEKALEFAKKELQHVDHVAFAPNAFQGRGFLANYATTAFDSVDDMAKSSVYSLEVLTGSMRALRSATSSMFSETPDDQAGVMRSLSAIHSLDSFFKKNSSFNEAGFSGKQWNVVTGVALQYTGGDYLPKFSVTNDNVERGSVTGAMSAASLQQLVRAGTLAMNESAILIKSLQSYATKLTKLNAAKIAASAVKLDLTSDSATVGERRAYRFGLLTCLTSTASVLRACATNYESCVLNYALDCGRAVKYATRKA